MFCARNDKNIVCYVHVLRKTNKYFKLAIIALHYYTTEIHF